MSSADMILALLSFAAAQAANPGMAEPVRLVDNGFCAGISWITLRPGEAVAKDNGPDFSVFRVRGPGDAWWGVYAGNASPANPNGPVLFERDGVTLRRAEAQQGIGAYLAQNRDGWQNHFFGSVFQQAEADRAFFERVDFSSAGRERCRLYWEAE